MIDRVAIAGVRPLIAPHIRRTPVVTVAGRDLGIAAESITFKLEFMQHAGSFKTRGAFTHLLTRPVPAAGVVAASGGNHGAAVAYAARALGVPAQIFVPAISSPAKIRRIESYGARLVVGGAGYDDARLAAEAAQRETGAMAIHAFDAVETLQGQGTLAAEFEDQAPDLDAVLVAIGGGGLVAGIAAWYGARVPVIAVEPEAAPTLHAAFAADGPADAPTGGIAADSLAPKRIGALVYPILRQHLAGMALVTDEAIRAAQRLLWEILRVVVEPGGAAATAALITGRYPVRPGARIGVVLSGGNTTAVDFDR